MVVIDGDRPDRPLGSLASSRGLTDEIWIIIEQAWTQDPKARLTFSDIVIKFKNVVSQECLGSKSLGSQARDGWPKLQASRITLPVLKPSLETNKRPVPQAVRLELTGTTKWDPSKPPTCALAATRTVDKLGVVKYPTVVSTPRKELYASAPEGDSRYVYSQYLHETLNNVPRSGCDFPPQSMSIWEGRPNLFAPLDNLDWGVSLSSRESTSRNAGQYDMHTSAWAQRVDQPKRADYLNLYNDLVTLWI